MKPVFLFVLIMILSFSVLAQNTENEEPNTVVQVPENVMREVVGRILSYKFKSPRRKKTILLAKEGIDPAWLPVIPNIEFLMLSAEEIADGDARVYFFTPPTLEENTYGIDFAFGDPNCEYEGRNWRFRVSGGKVRLWLGGNMGGGCGGNGSDFSDMPGKLNTYPNELEGYKFFDRGRLKDIKLTISTREDIRRAFGTDCESSCDYDENWRIYFTFFDNPKIITSGDKKPIKYVPDAKYDGKLYSIRMIPKATVLFNKIVFPSKFSKSDGMAMGCGWNASGSFSSVHTAYNRYSDRYGLEYTVFNEITFTLGDVKPEPRRKGELMSIEYVIPYKLEEEMFVEKK
jgi:hypothetical protein